MKIKPYIILGLSTFFAGAGLATVVITSDPYAAEQTMIRLFLFSLFLSVFGFVATLFSVFKQRLSIALLGGLIWGGGVVVATLLLRYSLVGARGLWIIAGTTLLLTFVVCIRAKRSTTHVQQP